MTDRVKKAVDIFLDAIRGGKLAKGTCLACAVGNLVANAMGKSIEISNYPKIINYEGYGFWKEVFFTTGDNVQHVKKRPESMWDSLAYLKGLAEIHMTDFSQEELMKIEYAFETNTKISIQKYDQFSPEEIRKDQVRGLEAVISTMLSFDGCGENVKEIFTDQANAIPLGECTLTNQT